MAEITLALFASLVVAGIGGTTIFFYITHPSARFTAGERPSLSTSREPAGSQSFPARRTNATLARWRTAARRWASTAMERFRRAALYRFLTDPVEFPSSVYAVEQCRVCRRDVHRLGEMCALQKSADCTACGQRVLLDYWGCPAAGRRSEVHSTHTLKNVAPTTAAEWRRAHFVILKPQLIERRVR